MDRTRSRTSHHHDRSSPMEENKMIEPRQLRRGEHYWAWNEKGKRWEVLYIDGEGTHIATGWGALSKNNMEELKLGPHLPRPHSIEIKARAHEIVGALAAKGMLCSDKEQRQKEICDTIEKLINEGFRDIEKRTQQTTR